MLDLFEGLLDHHDLLHVARVLLLLLHYLCRLLEVIIGQQVTEIQGLFRHLKLLGGGVRFGQLWQALHLPEQVKIEVAFEIAVTLPPQELFRLQEHLHVLVLLEARHHSLVHSLSLKLGQSMIL